MPLTWSENENPVSSVKLNKMSVTFWADEASIDTSQIQVGSVIYLEDINALKIVRQISPSLILDSVGGGMKLDLVFGRLRFKGGASDSFDLISDLQAIVVNRSPLLSRVDTVDTDGGAVATFTDSRTYEFAQKKDLGGKPIGKVFVAVVLPAHLTYGVGQAPTFKFNATNTKIEILDNGVVKATISLPVDVSKSFASGTRHNLHAQLEGVVDLNGFIFTNFQIKVTMQTNTSITTNLTAHVHRWFSTAVADLQSTTDPSVGSLQVEVKG